MEENKPQETFDPRDLNQDGKVTLSEKVQYAAGKAAEKAKEVYAEAFMPSKMIILRMLMLHG